MGRLIKPAAVILTVLLAPVFTLTQAQGQLVRPRKAFRGDTARIQHLRDLEARIFHLTNEARRKNGLAPLLKDESLAAAARDHSDDMLRRKFFAHENPDGVSIKERIPAYSQSVSRVGENIWGGSGQDYSDSRLMARLIVDGWMSSPGHRANILNPDYTHLGVGVSVLGNEIRATQEFATAR
jgi:uncharacterized protein YkwD